MTEARFFDRLRMTKIRFFGRLRMTKEGVILNEMKDLGFKKILIIYRIKEGEFMYYVYILTNWSNSVLYTGITSNLERRLYEHKNKLVEGFTNKYNVNKLVYYDITTDALTAIEREKQIKGWKRSKKIELIEKANPEWKDLSEEFY